MNKTLSDLELSQSPPTVADQVGSAVETLRAIKELSTAFTPPPPPPTSEGLSPERNMELELKKLEIEQQLEMYRINKQGEAESKRAQGMSEAVKMIGGAIEGIGKNIADQLMNSSPGYAPSGPSSVNEPTRTNHIADPDLADPSAVDDGENPLVGKLQCPDCGEEAVYITKEMWEAGQQGQSVLAACVACGAQHALGEEPSDNPPVPPVPPVPLEEVQGRQSTHAPASVGKNGKERPPRRNFVSVD